MSAGVTTQAGVTTAADPAAVCPEVAVAAAIGPVVAVATDAAVAAGLTVVPPAPGVRVPPEGPQAITMVAAPAAPNSVSTSRRL